MIGERLINLAMISIESETVKLLKH